MSNSICPGLIHLRNLPSLQRVVNMWSASKLGTGQKKQPRSKRYLTSGKKNFRKPKHSNLTLSRMIFLSSSTPKLLSSKIRLKKRKSKRPKRKEGFSRIQNFLQTKVHSLESLGTDLKTGNILPGNQFLRLFRNRKFSTASALRTSNRVCLEIAISCLPLPH